MKMINAVILFSSLFISFLGFSAEKLSVATFNTGLISELVIPYKEQREKLILDFLKKESSDILCLQEVWEKKTQDFFSKSLSNHYPYQFVPQVKNNILKKQFCHMCALGGCDFPPTHESIKLPVGCIIENKCNKVVKDDLIPCINKRCASSIKHYLEKYKKKGVACLASLISFASNQKDIQINDIINFILYDKHPDFFAYQGNSGLMILSKKKIQKTRIIEMKKLSTLSRRIMALVDVEIGDSVQRVGCTHLTADLKSDIPYVGLHTSWEEENRLQTKKFLKELKSENHSGNTILLGDFNSSPKLPSPKKVKKKNIFEPPILKNFHNQEIDASFPKTVDLILKDGYKATQWKDPFTQSSSSLCTYCQTNNLLKKIILKKTTLKKQKNKQVENYILDHIFYKGPSITPLETSVFADDIYTIQDENEQMVLINLSDHFGVRSSFLIK